MDKQTIITELRRIAEVLSSRHVTQRQFRDNSRISMSTVRYTFGSWNEAVKAAGLDPIPSSGLPELKKHALPDGVYLQEIMRLTRELGKKPTDSQMNAKGQYSIKPYRDRWGSLNRACQVAYATYGFPRGTGGELPEAQPLHVRIPQVPEDTGHAQIHKRTDTPRRKRVLFGEPINFRGLRFAPVNEQGVVYLFGMISRELGFLIESIRTEYPDCEGKRCVDPKNQIWEHFLIEFEFRSANFRDHGHRSEDCDLIVCWIHDWPEYPIEVLELKSQIRYLANG